ncbi:hypothetical protein AB1L07_02565 [Niallia alba]|uniref:hypothetical protein n=1 Tax=Niallia alba TaxID=2729105 RepID=UPI0039A18B54
MDVFSLKNYIIDNPDYIELVLEEVGFHKVKDIGKEYRCALDEHTNPTAVKVNKKTLSSSCYSINLKGDLIVLVQYKLNLSFPKAIKKIAELVEFKHEIHNEQYKLPFGGFYKNIQKLRDMEGVDIETYSYDLLNRFELAPNLLFYKDGILPHIQTQYEIGYDSLTRRISVPWYSFDGNLCGVMGRLNKKVINDEEVKWFPIVPFPKSKTLYGFANNYHSILDKGIVMIGESEKHTMSLASKGINVGISLGGSFMSEIQANHVKSLFPKTIILMLDEGLEEEHSIEIAKQLKSDKFYKNNVGYVFDKNNKYLPKGSKMAPSDLNKNKLNGLVKECIVWL